MLNELEPCSRYNIECSRRLHLSTIDYTHVQELQGLTEMPDIKMHDMKYQDIKLQDMKLLSRTRKISYERTLHHNAVSNGNFFYQNNVTT